MLALCLRVSRCGLFLGLIAPMWAWAGEDNAARLQGATNSPTTVRLVGTLPAGQPTVRVDADCDSATIAVVKLGHRGRRPGEEQSAAGRRVAQGRTRGKLVNLAGKGEKNGPQQVRFQMAASREPIDWTVRVDGRRA